ncbi:MAG: F0F1 ATP synthase subunit epsilon [Nitrospiraceae bacterium]|nr:F0F1 ATP synthase subunit epsilon [Nitrospiraceae bacterium]
MAEEKLLLEIVTPQGLVYSGKVDEVTASGSEGEFGVLPGHAPFITTIKIGMVSGRVGKDYKFFFVNWGYAEVSSDKIVILADRAELSEESDIEKARAAMKEAEERFRKCETCDAHKAEAALERAVTGVNISKVKTPK